MKRFILVNNYSTREQKQQNKILKGGVFMKKLMAGLFILGAMGAYATGNEEANWRPDFLEAKGDILIRAHLVKPLELYFGGPNGNIVDFGQVGNTKDLINAAHHKTVRALVKGSKHANVKMWVEDKVMSPDGLTYITLDNRHFNDSKLYVKYYTDHGNIDDGKIVNLGRDGEHTENIHFKLDGTTTYSKNRRVEDGCYEGKVTLKVKYDGLSCGAPCAS